MGLHNYQCHFEVRHIILFWGPWGNNKNDNNSNNNDDNKNHNGNNDDGNKICPNSIYIYKQRICTVIHVYIYMYIVEAVL